MTLPRGRVPRGYAERSSRVSAWIAALALAAAALLLVRAIPAAVFTPGTQVFIVTLGVVGVWRYSWAALHFVRAFLYRYVVFPRLRRAAEAMGGAMPHVYVVVTSFRMSAEVNTAVYGRLIDEIVAGGGSGTIIAGITDPADLDVLRRVATSRAAERVVIQPIFQSGRGKREVLGDALERIAAAHPAPGAQVVLMDGDTLLGEGCLARASSILRANPDVGALTTENVPLVKGGAIRREWYRLRMTQRGVLMSSLSLSRKVLVLTGRFSLFRAEVATRPDFVVAVRADTVRHWRLGRIALLTGDDKSTWFAVLKGGWNMLYVPDAVAYALEEMPPGGFFPTSVSLMSRWYGNMIRASGRALALGPARTGLFLWLCLLDQRLSMWTTLMGPTFATLLAALYAPVFLLVYLLWVLLTRGVVCLLVAAHSGRWHPLFPVLLYYTQFVGSLVKVYMSFHPYRQKWTRQRIPARGGAGGRDLLHAMVSHAYAAAAAVAFVLFVAYVGGVADQAERRLGRASGTEASALVEVDGFVR